jgi:hypothetical protein
MTALTLTYVPILESIHVYLNGVEQYQPDDWTYNSVSNRIDVETPMDARSDDLLECRYAYREPRISNPEVIANQHGDFATGTWTLYLPTAPAAGSGVILGGGAPFGVTLAPVGMGATWTLVAGGTGREVWFGEDCDGTNGVTIHGGSAVAHATAVEVKNVTAAGAVTDVDLAGTPMAGPLIAPPQGGIAFCYYVAIGATATLVTETPSPWTVLENSGNPRRHFGVVEVAGGGTAQREFSDTDSWTIVILAGT